MDLKYASENSKIENFDIEKGERSFQEQGAKKKIGMAKFKTDGKSTSLVLNGEVCTNGICVNEFSNGKVYSIGFKFNDDEHVNYFNELNNSLETFATDDYTCTNVLKDDVLYLKLKLSNDKKSFLAKSNKKIDPKKPADFPASGDEVVVVADLSCYFNFEDKKCGLLLNVKSFEFI